MKIDAFNAIARLAQNLESQVARTTAAVEKTLSQPVDRFVAGIAHRSEGVANRGTKIPPMPSFGDTIVAGQVSWSTDEAKIARGALKIDPKTPGKYDGMYIGADGWAYPPSKFKASEVPPFRPEHRRSEPTPTTYYVNGLYTWPDAPPDIGHVSSDAQVANGEAQQVADKTGTNVVLIYNATSKDKFLDGFQTAMDRMVVGDNPAVDTLADAIYADLKAGKKVNVEGYSQGGAIASYALQKVDGRLSKENADRTKLLSNVNVVTFGGAGKDFPDGPKYTFYVNHADPIPTWFGAHAWNPGSDLTESILEAWAPWLLVVNHGLPFFQAKGACVFTFDDPGTSKDTLNVDGTHGINTYFRNIPDPS